jgi:hypothetical protein
MEHCTSAFFTCKPQAVGHSIPNRFTLPPPLIFIDVRYLENIGSVFLVFPLNYFCFGVLLFEKDVCIFRFSQLP